MMRAREGSFFHSSHGNPTRRKIARHNERSQKMAGVNLVVAIGNLGRDPEIKYIQDGTAVANISLAVNEKWKGRDGKQNERTEWIRAVLWGRLAEVAKEYLSKGDPVYIQGKLQTRSWDDKNGTKRSTTEVRVDVMKMLGSRDRSGSRDSAAPSQYDGSSDDDIPF